MRHGCVFSITYWIDQQLVCLLMTFLRHLDQQCMWTCVEHYCDIIIIMMPFNPKSGRGAHFQFNASTERWCVRWSDWLVYTSQPISNALSFRLNTLSAKQTHTKGTNTLSVSSRVTELKHHRLDKEIATMFTASYVAQCFSLIWSPSEAWN